MSTISRTRNKLSLVSLRLPRRKFIDACKFYETAFNFIAADEPWSANEEFHLQDDAEGVRTCQRTLKGSRLSLSRASDSFPIDSAGIEFITIDEESNTYDFSDYSADRSDLYWKIGIALHDLDLSIPNMIMRIPGFSMEPASQFLNIGYLAHLRDPAGFTVELLQTTFEGNREKRLELVQRSTAKRPKLDGEMEEETSKSSSPCAQDLDVVIGQITTRISDRAASLDFYQNIMGMKLLSIQPVEQYGFVLFFLAYTDETPPNAADLEAVENREWCWQRPYTTLELQLRQSSGSLRKPGPCESGLESLTVRLEKDSEIWVHLERRIKKDGLGRRYVEDPDGLKIVLEKSG